MRVKIKPAALKGGVRVPGSKSMGHRALIIGALSNETTLIENLTPSQDISATMEGLRALGANIRQKDAGLWQVNKGEYKEKAEVFCGQEPGSGSTLRFLLPFALARGGEFTFTGAKRLFARPLEEYYQLFNEQNIAYKATADALWVKGRLTADTFSLRGDRSSQFASGLLMAFAPNVTLHFTTPLQSRPYLTMTAQMLAQAGAITTVKENTASSLGVLNGAHFKVEPDFSQAAFWLAANALGQQIEMADPLPEKSCQGDSQIVSLCKQLPARIDAGDIPDLVPILAVLACGKEYPVTIYNAARLRFKESDRLSATAEELRNIGANVQETEDGLRILPSAFKGGQADARNDHRIAMALAIAASVAKAEVTLEGAESVQKSYPEFWRHYKALGGEFTEQP